MPLALHKVKPICAKCMKEVDQVEILRSINTPTMYYKVFCHGEEEKFEFNPLIWAGKIEVGLAFQEKELPPPIQTPKTKELDKYTDIV